MASLRVSILPAVLGGLVAAAAPSAARATDYVVSPTGNDTATGMSGSPWRTIQRSLNTVKAGDVVTVEDGTYAGLACDGVSGTAAARIVFRSRNKWGAKITSPTSGSSEDYVQFASCSFITFDGFEVSGAPRSGIAILGNENDGSDARGVTIQNCFSHNNGGTSTAGRHDGVFSGFALDLTIQDNRIDTVGEHGIYVSNAADNPAILRNDINNTGNNCIQINADLSTGGDGLISNWRIEGNTVRNCKGSAGFNLDGAIRGVARNNVIYNASKGGITLFQGDGAEASHSNLIVNNTVYNPTGSRSAIQVADGANNNVIFNNIFITASTGLEVQSVTGLMHDYNIVSSYSGSSATAHEAMPGNAAALFVDAANGDLRLAAPSPALAVDKGIASFGGAQAPATDVLGASRPVGAAHDIGAYESGGVVAPAGTGGTSGTSGSAGTGGGTAGAGGRGGTVGPGGAGGPGGSSGPGGTSGTGASGGRGGSNGSTGGAGATAGASGEVPGGVNGGCGCLAAGARGARASGFATNLLVAPISFLLLRRRRRR